MKGVTIPLTLKHVLVSVRSCARNPTCVDNRGMTLPRRILPGRAWSIVRTCSRRSFVLRPDPVVNQVVKYCVAASAERYGVLLVALCAMSNHLHLEAIDVEGRLPEFMAYVDRLIAMCLKEHFGIEENVWSVNGYDPVELTTGESILEKAVYCLANPVQAGLVACSKDWPGVVNRPDACVRRPEAVKRPKVFFSENGKMPAEVELVFHKPPGFEDQTDAEFARTLAEALHRREREVAGEMKRIGRSFKGSKAVSRQRHTARPRNKRGGGINPRVAGRRGEARVHALLSLRSFHDAYRKAWAQFRDGVRDVCFPEGTWRLRVHYAVRCHPIPA